MENLWKVVAEIGAELHPDRIDVAAAKIETLGSADSFSLSVRSFGVNADKTLLKRLEEAWHPPRRSGLSMLTRLVANGGWPGNNPWVVVQPEQYRYHASLKDGVHIRFVIQEYLACHVYWADDI